jgi:hypothetical protein
MFERFHTSPVIGRYFRSLLMIAVSIAVGWFAHALWTYDPHRGRQFQLNDAAGRGDVRYMERLVAAGANPTGRAVAENGSIDAGTAIDRAASAGEPESTAWLLDRGADTQTKKTST